jgi:hypothetical protein
VSPRKPLRRALVVGLASLVFGVASQAAAPVVRYQDGRLWVRANGVAAPDVFSAIAQRTGVRFVVDKELSPGALTIDVDGLELERALRAIVASIPQAAGHSMSYTSDADGTARLSEVSIYGPGKKIAGTGSEVYEAPTPAAPVPIPTPDLQERMDKMIAAGVPRETAEKVIELTVEVQKLQATPEPGSYRPEDLSPASREQLQPLIDRGVPMERAVQMLLLQEKYQQTLKDLSNTPGLAAGQVSLPPPPAGSAEPEETRDEAE